MASILLFGSTTTARDKKIQETLAEMEMEPHENNPDLLIIEPQDKKKTIGIGQARSTSKFLSEKPFQHKNKVVVINKAELLTTQAQNALLKTLEEPPSYATIILSAKTENSLLETVVSRCKKVRVDGKVERKSERPAVEDVLGMSIGERLEWAADYSKEDREVVVETFEEWLAQLRENLDTTAVKNIEIIVEIRNDLEHTNVSLKLALENLVLKII